MKRIIIPALALLLGLTSCNWLERNPKATLAPENYFRDETDLQLFSNSFYNNLLPCRTPAAAGATAPAPGATSGR